MRKIGKVHQYIQRLKNVGFQEVVMFSSEEEETIPLVIKDLKYLMRYIDKVDKNEIEEDRVIHKLHESYKKIIGEMKRKHEEMQAKASRDLIILMNKLAKGENRVEALFGTKKEGVKKMNSMEIGTDDLEGNNSEAKKMSKRILELEKKLADEIKRSSKI